jgi:hypothetical protein
LYQSSSEGPIEVPDEDGDEDGDACRTVRLLTLRIRSIGMRATLPKSEGKCICTSAHGTIGAHASNERLNSS